MPLPRLVPSTASADGTLLLLLGLNLLLLAFFILLNSMATHGARHASDVMARVKEGYNVQGSYTGGDADAPRQPLAYWKQQVTGRMQGVVLNRLGLSTVPLEADANRVEVLIPLETLFSEGEVANPPVVKALNAAAGPESRVVWVMEGASATEETAHQAAALAALGVVAQVQVSGEAPPQPRVRVVVVPGVTTPSDRGGQVQRVGTQLGGAVQGVRYE